MELNPTTKKWLIGGLIILILVLFVVVMIFIRVTRGGASITTNQGVTLFDVVADEDHDGIPDDTEKNTYHTDPKKEDTDADGLSDLQEIQQFKTDPLNAHSKDFNVLDSKWVYQNTTKQTIQYK